MSGPLTGHQRGHVKITPRLRSLALEQRRCLNKAEEAIAVGRKQRTIDIYMRALRAFMNFDPEIVSLFAEHNFYVHGHHFRRYCAYLEAKEGVHVFFRISNLLYALIVAFPGQFDDQALRALCEKYKPLKIAGRLDVITISRQSLHEKEQEFVDHIEQEFGYHRKDDYLRFLGHIKRFSPDILEIDFQERFLRPSFEAVLTEWLGTISVATSLKGFQFIGQELDAWLGADSYQWLRPAILSRMKALLPNASKPKTGASPARYPSLTAPRVAADMRIPPLFDLMEEIAPTHQSQIRPSRKIGAVKATSRKMLDHDVLQLINARIERGLGSPLEPAKQVMSLPSLMALTDYLERKGLDPRTIGRTLGRIRWLRRRLFPFDDDHGLLYLSVVGRQQFLSRRPERRNVHHIHYVDLMEKLQAFLAEVEAGIKRGSWRHSLRRVEWRDLLIAALMLTTGIRVKNAHGLRSGWIRLGPNPGIFIPAGSVKNARPFVCALPEWLAISLQAYAPDLGHPALPDFPVWRSRDTASLSRASVERSVRKTSLCLLNEPLQPHDYRRLRCIFIQDSDELDQSKAHLVSGHSDPDLLYTCYATETIPDYIDDVLASSRASRLVARLVP